MKRRDMVKIFKRNGWWIKRNAGHQIWTDGVNCEALSWSTEIPEMVAQNITKRRKLK